MGRYHSLASTLALGLLAVLLAPVLVLAGEPALRHHRRHWRERRFAAALTSPAPSRSGLGDLLLLRFAAHPLVIALTAPGRWIRPRLRHALRRRPLTTPLTLRRTRKIGRWLSERLRPDDPPYLSGVREPRRPKPNPPADAVALRPPTGGSDLD